MMSKMKKSKFSPTITNVLKAFQTQSGLPSHSCEWKAEYLEATESLAIQEYHQPVPVAANQKKSLAQETGLTILQIDYWFTFGNHCLILGRIEYSKIKDLYLLSFIFYLLEIKSSGGCAHGPLSLFPRRRCTSVAIVFHRLII